MKKLIICLFTASAFLSAAAQSDSIPRNAEGKYEYSEVVNVDSASAAKLYSNAKLFIVTAFKSGKAVTQLNDDAAKTVAGNGNVQIVLKGLASSGVTKRVSFSILIQCKDGRYKYTINDFQISFKSDMINRTFPFEDEKGFKNKLLTTKRTEELYEIFKGDMNTLISDLKKAMASQSESTKDW